MLVVLFIYSFENKEFPSRFTTCTAIRATGRGVGKPGLCYDLVQQSQRRQEKEGGDFVDAFFPVVDVCFSYASHPVLSISLRERGGGREKVVCVERGSGGKEGKRHRENACL